MTTRSEDTRLGAFLLASVVIHVLAAIALASNERITLVETASIPRLSDVVSVRLARPPAPVPPPVAAEPPPVVETPPKPPIEQAVERAPEPPPKPVEKNVATPAPPVAVPLPIVETTPEVAEPIPDLAAAAVETAPMLPDAPVPSDAAPTEDPLALYVAEVRARILAQRKYPSLARKRSIEGDVDARLEIDAEGRLTSLRISEDAPRVLTRATEKAIRRAAPFPPPPEGAKVIEIPIVYSLRDAI